MEHLFYIERNDNEVLSDFDSHTCTIQGDLARNDVVVLCELCKGKRVIEFGMGGSTTLLARVTQQLYSYDTDNNWLQLVYKRLQQLDLDGYKHGTVELQLVSDVPDSLPDHDVLWIDGYFQQRRQWLERFGDAASIIILHDSRADRVSDVMSGYFVVKNRLVSTTSIDFHYRDSNMIVIRRGQPVKLSNWNVVEKSGRTKHRNPIYVP